MRNDASVYRVFLWMKKALHVIHMQCIEKGTYDRMTVLSKFFCLNDTIYG